ncbi:retropepsin-like aspartic protease family protein [Lentiprolixibacter aurantiacus]|uniref:Retropepsin-like aspartic protease n=1 Tax=Lentiprolixibacter aurantiacus TaxID=2993939 RepID=A0AAE3MKA1_9FLAO|nr:retropepsin-like aspartic protease [Lentiprolixibacter aurantiacus]MCX2718984.1 retropepsin-like aspartic protease [Lentiprolixibacter aurantiacus]
MASLRKFLEKKNYVRIPLVYTATNHFELRAKINGQPGRFIVDTGASNTCVSFDKIDYFKLTTKESEVKAAGAGATDMATLISSKNKLEIGAWTKNKLKLVLFDLVHVNEALVAHEALPVDGIIGADVLKKAKAVIDYDKKCLYLRLNPKKEMSSKT